MPDPTESVIIATFSAALCAFVLAAVVRHSLGRKPVAGAEAGPPELPTGRVPTYLYRPLDLLAIGFILVVFFSLVIASVRAGSKEDMELGYAALLQSIIFQFGVAGIATLMVVPRIRVSEWLGLKWPAWHWIFLIAPITVVAMWIFFGGLQASGYMKWIESFGVETVQDTVKIFQKSSNPIVLGLMAFAAIVVAPLCEEIVFRGYLYPVMKKFSGPWVAGVCSALIFAAAHGSLVALLPLFVFGCVLVFIYEKTGSLWAPIAVHFCFNAATIMIQMAVRYLDLPLDVAP